MPSVDIAIPCYQYGRYLPDCVNSVLSQGIDNLRILIIDNASTDGSAQIALDLAAKDSRIIVNARPVNLGPQASFNEGVDWAQGDYFMVLCADDRMAPGALARAVTALEEHPSASFAHGRTISVLADGTNTTANSGAPGVDWALIDGRAFIERFCERAVNHISGCTALVRTKYQKAVGHYREKLPHTDDFEMWMRLALLGPVAETNAVHGISLIHGANQSAYYHEKQTRDLLALKDAFDSFFTQEGRTMTGAERLHKRALLRIGERSYWSALSHLRRGKIVAALDLFKLAMRLKPSAAILPPMGYLIDRWRMNSAIRS